MALFNIFPQSYRSRLSKCVNTVIKLAPEVHTQRTAFPVKAIKCFIYILGIKQAIQAL